MIPKSLPLSPRPPLTNISQASPLLSLPPELLRSILPYLPYPDALSLKHTSRALYLCTDTSVPLKVSWLLARNMRGLPWPKRSCDLKTDKAFCNGEEGEVRRIMEKRRRHEECRPNDKGCEILLGRTCEKARWYRTTFHLGRWGRSWEGKCRGGFILWIGSILTLLVLEMTTWLFF